MDRHFLHTPYRHQVSLPSASDEAPTSTAPPASGGHTGSSPGPCTGRSPSPGEPFLHSHPPLHHHYLQGRTAKVEKFI